MNHRNRRMPFATWVDTHVHYLRAPRLRAIMILLEEHGPLLSYVVQRLLDRVRARLRARTHAHPSARLAVNIDTVRRDILLLIERGYLRRVNAGDAYKWGGGRQVPVWRYELIPGTL